MQNTSPVVGKVCINDVHRKVITVRLQYFNFLKKGAQCKLIVSRHSSCIKKYVLLHTVYASFLFTTFIYLSRKEGTRRVCV